MENDCSKNVWLVAGKLKVHRRDRKGYDMMVRLWFSLNGEIGEISREVLQRMWKNI